MKTIRQILAIAHTEFRFGLRRGGPVVTTILIGLVCWAGVLLGVMANLPYTKDEFNHQLQDNALIERLAEKGISPDNYRQIVAGSMAAMTVFSVPMAWPMLLLSSFLLLPAATATILPADRKFGMAELLHSMPITGGSYLAGKILGVSLTVVLISLIPFLLFFGVLAWAFLDAFQVGIPADLVWFFIKFAMLDGLPILGCGLVIGILVGSGFRTRRAAILPGLLAGILSLVVWWIAFKAPTLPFMQLDIATYYLLQDYHSTVLDALSRLSGLTAPSLLGEGIPIIGIGQVFAMYLIIAVTLFSLAVMARLWLKWKENF
jgi:ABC-type transport system involved in multi-copper enzyme maturation permease subunit